MQAGHGIFRAAILILTLTVWCCFVDIAEGGTAGITVSGSTTYPDGGMRRMDHATVNSAYGSPRSGLIDPSTGLSYFGADTEPVHILKVAPGSGNIAPEVIDDRVLDAQQHDPYGGVIDSDNGVSYFAMYTDPGRIVRVNLDFTSGSAVSELKLDDVKMPRAAVIDTSNGYAYFGSDSSLSPYDGRVVKVDINPARAFDQVGLAELNSGENRLLCGVIDVPNGYAYFGTYSTPGSIIKIALGAGNADPTRLGSTPFEAGENNLRCAVIDPTRGYAYFGTGTSPAKVVKVALGTGAALPTPVGTLTLHTGENQLASALIDTEANLAWFGTDTNPGLIVKVDLSSGDNVPEYLGSLSLGNDEKQCLSVAGDPERGYAYFGTQKFLTSSARIVRVALSQKSFIKGSRITLPEATEINSVSFFSHAAAGNVRLAIYSTAANPALLWRSPVLSNTVAGDWLTVPISAGIPASLNLAAGSYYLAWQVDTNAAVPGYTAGTAGSGFLVPYLWGEFPAVLSGNTAPAPTTETWSMYLTYGMTNEGEGEPPAEGEGEVLPEGEGEVLPEGEGEVLPEGEGEVLPEGEGEVLPEGEGEVLPEGEGEVLPEGEGEVLPEGEGEVLPEGEGEVLPEGEGEVLPEGEGEVLPEGEGEVLPEGEGEVLPEGEGEVLPEGEGEVLPEGEGEVLPEGEGEVLPEGEGEVLPEGEGEPPMGFALLYLGPNPLHVVSGERVSITVTPVNATGIVDFQWYHYRDNKKFELLADVDGDTLVFERVSMEDSGQYFCVAIDATGEATSPIIFLEVAWGLGLADVLGVVAAALLLGLAGGYFARRREGRGMTGSR